MHIRPVVPSRDQGADMLKQDYFFKSQFLKSIPHGLFLPPRRLWQRCLNRKSDK